MEKYYLKNFIIGNENLNYHYFSGESVPHSHDYFEFMLITLGPVNHVYMDNTYILNTKELVLIKPNIDHDPSSSTKSQHFTLSFSDSLCKQICDEISPAFYDYIVNANSDFKCTLTDLEFDYFNYRTRHLMANSISSDTKTDDFIVKTILEDFILKIYFKYFIAVSKNEYNYYPEWFQKFIRKISKPDIFTAKISDIYALSGYSQSAIIKYFKQYTGKTLIEYVTKLRCLYACNLLKKSDKTILDITYICGYSSLSRFVTVFRKHTGKNPSEYRKYHMVNIYYPDKPKT